MLLNKRRILRRRGKFLEADVLADKINAIIQRKQSESLSNLTSQSTRKLWAAHDSHITKWKNVSALPCNLRILKYTTVHSIGLLQCDRKCKMYNGTIFVLMHPLSMFASNVVYELIF